MKRKILLITFVITSILEYCYSIETNQCETGATPIIGDTEITALNLCVSQDYSCPTASQIWCGTGMECVAFASWCSGAGNDCSNNVDEVTTSGGYCSSSTTVASNYAACQGCTALTTLTTTNFADRSCQPVVWDPPMTLRSADVMIADCNHFPGTTFPAGTTSVAYTAVVGGLRTHRYCIFEVTLPDPLICDPPVTGCPDATVTATADAGETTAIVRWTEITTSDSTATVTIDNENHRPGSAFPIGYTRVEYTVAKPDGTKSYCIFYVHVKGF